MSALIRYVLCASILATSFSLKPAYKAAKFTATGIGLAATAYTADLLRNYVQYPHPNLARSATYKDMDDLQRNFAQACTKYLTPLQKEFEELEKISNPEALQNFKDKKQSLTAPVATFLAQHVKPAYEKTTENLDAVSNSALENMQPMASALHLKLYPKKEDCPCITGFDACPAHQVNFGEALLIKAAKLAQKPKLK